MGYTAGEIIKDDEYNAFVSNSSSPFGYNHFAGVGAAGYGLGQTEIPTVEATKSLTAAQWNTVLAGLDAIANHTNDTMTARGQVTSGDTIKIKAAVEADLATLAASVNGGCVNSTAINTGSELQSSRSDARWAGSHTVEHSITFANANNLRYFFNAGGSMRMKFTRVANGGSGATSKDNSVDELISAVGNFDLAAARSLRSGSGETLSTNGLGIGAQDLTTSYQTLMVLTQSSGSYTSMNVKVEAKANNTYGSATVVTMKYTLTDADGGDSQFTDGNTSSVDQYANFIGTTDFDTRVCFPTTDQGLATVYTIASSAQVSNSTA
jgi:hypothetical protein